MGISYGEIKKNKKEYWDLYSWIKRNHCPLFNMRRKLLSINKKWEEEGLYESDKDLPDGGGIRDDDKFNVIIFSKKMGDTFGWPDPISGQPYTRKDPVWWLTIGWWSYIFKGLYKVLLFFSKNSGGHYNKNDYDRV